MVTYRYRCAACGEDQIEGDFPIGTAPRGFPCDCGMMADLLIGADVQIAPSALEARGEHVRLLAEKEARWHKDMPAYKRLRHRGVQPNQIDGSAELEDRVSTQIEYECDRMSDSEVKVTPERLIAAQEQAKEIMANGIPR